MEHCRAYKIRFILRGYAVTVAEPMTRSAVTPGGIIATESTTQGTGMQRQ
ncbi:MAG: hypothetical protein ACXQTH_00095 [Dehalococcoidia bacterium]